MKTIEFIREKGLQALKEELSIEIKKYPGFFVLNYNQLDSPVLSPIVQECRGLILSDDLEVIARGFGRFFNYGETPQVTSAMKYEGAKAYVKHDGSLINLYYHPITKQWEVATRNAAYAEGFEKTATLKYKQLVCIALGFDTKEQTTDAEFSRKVAIANLDKDFCYLFELTSPMNRDVRPYKDYRMWLLGAVHKQTGEEILFEELRGLVLDKLAEQNLVGFLPEYETLENEDHLKRLLAKGGNQLEEGYVVHNEKQGLRVKAKFPGYLAAKHIRAPDGNHIPQRIATLVVTGEHIEWLSYNQKDEEIFAPYVVARERLKSEMISIQEEVDGISEQKELAQRVKHLVYSGIIFKARKANCSIWEMFLSEDTKQQAKIVVQAKNK